MVADLASLKADTAAAEALVEKDMLAAAKAYQSTVLTDMAKLRASADEAEALIPDELLPYPTYGKLLFQV
jgi:glutamine synthetase